jgi:hypothetical protein
MKLALFAVLGLLVATPSFAAGHASTSGARAVPQAAQPRTNNSTIHRPNSTCHQGLTICWNQ